MAKYGQPQRTPAPIHNPPAKPVQPPNTYVPGTPIQGVDPNAMGPGNVPFDIPNPNVASGPEPGAGAVPGNPRILRGGG